MRPLIHDLTGKKVVIFGGGDVGERKARFFEGEADVTVISQTFTEGFDDLDVDRVTRDIAKNDAYKEHLVDAFLVVPATSDAALNAEIEEEARRRGALVNRVDGTGEVVVPSVLDFDEFMVAITTYGKSPAVSKRVRQRLEEALGEEFSGMVTVQEKARALLKETVEEQRERSRVLNELMRDDGVWKLLREGRTDEAWERSKEVIRSAV